MSYLPRNERRTEVLDAVVRIAGIHGLDGATVRRVCAEVGISAGNIHHLFGSAAELKREAFRHFSEIEIAKLDAAADKPSPIEQLIAYLSSVSYGIDASARRVWSSAGQEASRDPEFGALWDEKAEIWLSRISELLIRLSGEGTTPQAASEAAWRLMSFSVGAISFNGTGGHGMNAEEVNVHINRMIAYELASLTAAATEAA